MTKLSHSLKQTHSNCAGNHRFILSHIISKKSDAVSNPSPTKNYKKSVSPSLVYRPLTLDKRQHVGFKVTYCGKGNRAVNFDKRKLSLIMIPDVNYLRSYRPIAGAIARQTRAEVICCAYQKLETRDLNDDLITRLVERLRFERSKLRNVTILSENDRLFDIFKRRLTAHAVASVDITTPTEELPTQLVLEEAPISSPEKSGVISRTSRHSRKKQVQFVQISREESSSSSEHSPGIFKRMMSSITSKLSDLFRQKQIQEIQDSVVGSTSSNFDFFDRTFIINRNMNLGNSAHCDLIAKLMIAESTKH